MELKLAPLWEQGHHRNNNNKDVVNNVNISTQGIWNRRHISECQSPKNVSVNLMHSGTQHTFPLLMDICSYHTSRPATLVDDAAPTFFFVNTVAASGWLRLNTFSSIV